MVERAIEASQLASFSVGAGYQQYAMHGFRLLRQLAIATVLVFAVGGYWEYKQEQATLIKLEAEKAIAVIRAAEEETAMLGASQVPLVSSCSPQREI